ncbi:MAG TPA: TonB-dependent receptor [Burkholderiales bacterium]|nr:TonB-dependent receptor [Burkholderiales bacterium]
MKSFYTLGLMVLILGNTVHADDELSVVTENVVVTAARVPQQASQSLQPVTVITSDEIAESGQQTLVEVLQSRAGLEITSTGGFGQPSGVFMRGANSNQTLVLIDGLRVDSATTGATALENIPLNQIERIEIVPGPLSSLYGSEAIGGVIQIFTKSAKYAPGASLSAGYGSFNTRSVSGGINTRYNDTDFSLNAGYFISGGFDATKPSIDAPGTPPAFQIHNPDSDDYHNSNYSLKLAQHFTTDHEFGLTAFQSFGNTRFDSGPSTDDINRQTLSAFSLYSRNQLTTKWQSLLRIGMGRDNQDISGAFPGFFRTTQPQLTWQNSFSLSGGSLIAGFEYLDQKLASNTPYNATQRDIRSVFGGYVGEFGPHGVQLNVRNDDNSQFGNQTTGSVGYGYRLNPYLRLRASGGTAFKAPTFNDLYFPGFSNPNLQPEHSRSYETGVDASVGEHQLRLIYFDNRITDLIILVPDPNTFTFTPENVNEARINGGEISYQGSFAGFVTNMHITVQNPVNSLTGQQLQRRAKQYGSFIVNRNLGPLKIGAELVTSSERFDSANEDPTTRLPGYALYNLTVNYALAREWSFNLRWNNIFNRNYQLVQNFNTAGSNVFFALRYEPQLKNIQP